jgi:hypothetical protein
VIGRLVASALAPLVGRPFVLPRELLARYPELAIVNFRRGGLPPRVGGWALLQRSAAAITLWRTVFLAPETPLDPGLLLHEFRHVQHFASSVWFPVRYLWGSIRLGYQRNPYELDADRFAAYRLAGARAAVSRDSGPGSRAVPPSPDE